MGKTYQYLPVSIPEIFRDIVTTVSTNLAAEDSLNIPAVYFRCETWLELVAHLTVDAKHPDYANTRYPLIALIRNYDEKFTDDNGYADVSLNLIIVTRSTADKKSQQREDDNYIPILRPIYSEFMECIKNSRKFANYFDTMPTHTKTESFVLGKEGNKGNTAYSLPDVVDGIIVTDLRLKVVPARGSLPMYGPVVAVTYLNNVSELTLSGVDTSRLSVELVSAQHTDLLAIAQEPIYTVYFGHNPTVPYPIDIGDTIISDVQAVDTGDYYGYVQCDDGYKISKLYFYYKINGHRVKNLQTTSKFELSNFVLTLNQSGAYPFDAITRVINHVPIIKGTSLSIDGGNAISDILYQPPVSDTTEVTTTISELMTSTQRDVINTVSQDGIDFENISYYNINLI